MPTETESMSAPHFEDALWQVLADAHRERQTDGGGRRRPRSSGPVVPMGRRRGRRPVLVGASAAAAVATLVVALALRHDPDRPDTVIDQSSVVIPADLLPRVRAAAQEGSASMIVHGTMSDLGDTQLDYEMWTDEQSTALRVVTFDDGQVSWDTHPATAPGDGPVVESVVVNHCTQEYSPIEPMPDPGPVSTVLTLLEGGYLVEDGTEVIDGRELIRLVEKPQTEPAPGVQTVEIDPETGEAISQDVELTVEPTTVWVDPHTYRPVRMDSAYTRSYEYLPRTPENLAQFLSPPIPEGFTAVPALSNPSPDCH